MKDVERRSGLYDALGWGALFIWAGVASFVRDLPTGAGVFGVGAILLALNVARRLSGIPADHFSLVLGSIAAVGGATVFVLHQWFGMPPAELPLLPTIFLGIGVVIVAYAVASWRRTRQSGGTPN
jgi:hypothetical protein